MLAMALAIVLKRHYGNNPHITKFGILFAFSELFLTQIPMVDINIIEVSNLYSFLNTTKHVWTISWYFSHTVICFSMNTGSLHNFTHFDPFGRLYKNVQIKFLFSNLNIFLNTNKHVWTIWWHFSHTVMCCSMKTTIFPNFTHFWAFWPTIPKICNSNFGNNPFLTL